MAKLTFKEGDIVSVNDADFQIVKVRNGNIMVRPLGGYDTEGDEMVLRQPRLTKSKKSSSKDNDEE